MSRGVLKRFFDLHRCLKGANCSSVHPVGISSCHGVIHPAHLQPAFTALPRLHGGHAYTTRLVGVQSALQQGSAPGQLLQQQLQHKHHDAFALALVGTSVTQHRSNSGAANADSTGGGSTTSNSSSSSLRDLLAAQQVSYRAIVSLLECSRKQELHPERTASNILQLQECFGAATVNKMLQRHPLIATRKPDLLLKHFEGLKQVLGGDEGAARRVVSYSPELLNHSPDTIGRRMAELQELLQVSQVDIQRLVQNSPPLLKCQPARVAERVRCVQQLTGLTLHEVLKVLSRTFVLATTSVAQLVNRQRVLAGLLHASPDEMVRVCNIYPELLTRDPAFVSSTIDSIALHLQISQEDAAALVRSNPAILSWNTSTLLNRITVVWQSLRLPPELREVLLTRPHRPLLSHSADIPHRLEFLKEYLGMPESDILELLSSKLTVLRLTPEQMQSKAACATSLAMLHHAWQADLQTMSPGQKLRILQLGHVPFWRLVYLVQTGQQDCGTLKQYLNASNAVFDNLHPDFKNWLDRYNSIVAAKDIPLVPSITPPGSSSTACYTPVLPANASGRATAGSTSFSQGRWHAVRQATPGSPQAAQPCDGSSSLFAALPPTPAAMQQAPPNSRQATLPCGRSPAVLAALPPTLAAVLAAWWGVSEGAVVEMLSALKGPRQRFSLREWRERLQSLQALLAVLEPEGDHNTASTGHSSSSSSSTVSSSTSTSTGSNSSSSTRVSTSIDSSSVIGAAQADAGSFSSTLAGRPLVPAIAAASVLTEGNTSPGTQGPDNEQLPSAARRRRRQQVLPQSRQQQPHQQHQPGLAQPQQLQQQQSLDIFNLLPEAEAALQHALASGSADAVACISVACHLAPFSQQLHQLPPKPPDRVVQFALQYPQVIGRIAFPINCSALASLAAESDFLRMKLQLASDEVLCKCLDKHPVRVKMVQFLVQTRQPTPWAFTFEQLLVHEVLGPQGKGGSRAAFVAAYPQYQQWDEAMCSM